MDCLRCGAKGERGNKGKRGKTYNGGYNIYREARRGGKPHGIGGNRYQDGNRYKKREQVQENGNACTKEGNRY